MSIPKDILLRLQFSEHGRQRLSERYNLSGKEVENSIIGNIKMNQYRYIRKNDNRDIVEVVFAKKQIQVVIDQELRMIITVIPPIFLLPSNNDVKKLRKVIEDYETKEFNIARHIVKEADNLSKIKLKTLEEMVKTIYDFIRNHESHNTNYKDIKL